MLYCWNYLNYFIIQDLEKGSLLEERATCSLSSKSTGTEQTLVPAQEPGHAHSQPRGTSQQCHSSVCRLTLTKLGIHCVLPSRGPMLKDRERIYFWTGEAEWSDPSPDWAIPREPSLSSCPKETQGAVIPRCEGEPGAGRSQPRRAHLPQGWAGQDLHSGTACLKCYSWRQRKE